MGAEWSHLPQNFIGFSPEQETVWIGNDILKTNLQIRKKRSGAGSVGTEIRFKNLTTSSSYFAKY